MAAAGATGVAGLLLAIEKRRSCDGKDLTFYTRD
jgi:hypothetical protein